MIQYFRNSDAYDYVNLICCILSLFAFIGILLSIFYQPLSLWHILLIANLVAFAFMFYVTSTEYYLFSLLFTRFLGLFVNSKECFPIVMRYSSGKLICGLATRLYDGEIYGTFDQINILKTVFRYKNYFDYEYSLAYNGKVSPLPHCDGSSTYYHYCFKLWNPLNTEMLVNYHLVHDMPILKRKRYL